MANIKSAKKRILTDKKRAARNQAVKSGMKTAIKRVRTAVEAGDKSAAQEALVNATSVIDKAETKGVIKKGNASRRVSRLAKAVNGIG
ncbi:MAG: 30S ribosomal protein S20 [Lachnospiraceae bacterium]|nr:30S ribosomal protein S20 [Lachnospiraceae bacterium]